MNKKGFIDIELLSDPGFIILGGGAVLATVLGYIWGLKMGWDSFPIWQLLIIIAAEIGFSYFIALRNA
jgi:hypothetical protein